MRFHDVPVSVPVSVSGCVRLYLSVYIWLPVCVRVRTRARARACARVWALWSWGIAFWAFCTRLICGTLRGLLCIEEGLSGGSVPLTAPGSCGAVI